MVYIQIDQGAFEDGYLQIMVDPYIKDGEEEFSKELILPDGHKVQLVKSESVFTSHDEPLYEIKGDE